MQSMFVSEGAQLKLYFLPLNMKYQLGVQDHTDLLTTMSVKLRLYCTTAICYILAMLERDVDNNVVVSMQAGRGKQNYLINVFNIANSNTHCEKNESIAYCQSNAAPTPTRPRSFRGRIHNPHQTYEPLFISNAFMTTPPPQTQTARRH